LFGVSDPGSEDEVHIPGLNVTPPPRPSAHACAAAASLAVCDDEVPILRLFTPFEFCSVIKDPREQMFEKGFLTTNRSRCSLLVLISVLISLGHHSEETRAPRGEPY
jgi:hypothetical protein